MPDRIIQIIPAPPNMWVKWNPAGKDCDVDFGRIVCLALMENGKIVPMTVFEDDGIIADATGFSNFGGIVFSEYTIRKVDTDGD